MRHLETVMGVPMSLDLRLGEDAAGDERSRARVAVAIAAAFAELRDADARFSRHRTDSEVARFNRGDLRPGDVSAGFSEVIAIAENACRASAGAFTMHAPDGSLDLNGVVKGWAAARAAGRIRERGFGDFCLNAGGDVVVAGAPNPGEHWQIGVRSPFDPRRMLAVLAPGEAAVATSGAYERGQHVIDGRTGRPATGLLSATVIAADLTTADVLATAVFALGLDGVAWAVQRGARGVLAVDLAGRMLTAGELSLARTL